MKRLGLIGGMSWESTLTYYRLLNQGVQARLGGFHSADLLMHSVDFQRIESMQRSGEWNEAGALLAASGLGLQSAGAQALLLCTNTMHKVARDIEAAVTVPLLHIADATGKGVQRAGHSRIGLLGTRFTMEEAFYRQRLTDGFGLDVLTPDANARTDIDHIIFAELCRGNIRESSRETCRTVIANLVDRGAEAIVLGCTEIGLLVGEKDSAVPLFDTVELHVEAALTWMFNP